MPSQRAKTLFLDIETFPDLVYVWGVYEQNAIAVKQHWQLASFSAKWEGGKIVTRGLPDYVGYKAGGDDKALLDEVWQLLDEADIVVAHNGVDFDIKKLNARFIAHGLKAPSPYKVVDTKREVKKVAAFSSNKLDWLCKQLELGRKVEHEGFDLWLKCMAGDAGAWKRMKAYNRHDVELLEELFYYLKPWIRLPNAGVYIADGKRRCPHCGGKHLQQRGTAVSKTRIYTRFQCQNKDCRKWSRSTRSVAGVDVVAV